MRILVAEDDPGLRDVIVLGLQDNGYHVDAVERGEIVCVTGRVNRAIKTLFKLLPDRFALRTMQKRSKDFRAQN